MTATGIKKFIHSDAFVGVLLIAAALLALAASNSAFRDYYNALLLTPAAIQIGAFAIEKPLLLWINDGLMAVFFFLVGLEIKREVMCGELSTFDKASLPIFAAVGGMAVPALIYYLFNAADPVAVNGWAIPAATDIAFALGFLALIAAGAPFDLEALVPLIDDLFASAAELSVPVTELEPLFARLRRRGLRIGIASSDNERSIRVTVQRFGIGDYVDFVAGYDSGHGSKPGPGMVLGFCAETGLAPHQVAVVGDNNHDLHMGRNAGVGLKVAVLSGTGSRQSLEEACDILLNDITELEAALS